MTVGGATYNATASETIASTAEYMGNAIKQYVMKGKIFSSGVQEDGIYVDKVGTMEDYSNTVYTVPVE